MEEKGPRFGQGAQPGDEVEHRLDPVVALRALRALDDPPDLPDTIVERPDRLADVLFDHADRFDAKELLYLITCATIEELDDLVMEFLLQEFLLLDPTKLAEDVAVRLLSSSIEGRRVRPFRTWARRCVREAAKAAVDAGDLPALPFGARSATERRLMSEAAHVANHLGLEARRLAWYAWVEQFSPREIQMITLLPVERIEWVLQTVLERAWRSLQGLDETEDDSEFHWKRWLLARERAQPTADEFRSEDTREEEREHEEGGT